MNKPRNKFIKALKREPFGGLVPHFELVFYLTMESLGKIHPSNRNFAQWRQMSEKEKQLHREDISDTYIKTAEKYNHSSIFSHPAGWGQDYFDETINCLEIIREKTEDKYFLMIHGDSTYPLPEGSIMVDFVNQLTDNPDKMKEKANKQLETALERASLIARKGLLDGFALCSDYCFNTGPFLSPGIYTLEWI